MCACQHANCFKLQVQTAKHAAGTRAKRCAPSAGAAAPPPRYSSHASMPPTVSYYDAARLWRCSHMLPCCDIERVKHRRCSRFQPARLHLKCCRQKQRAAHSSCCSRLYYQDQAVTAADGTWTKDHKVQSAADAAAVLLLLLPHTLSHSFTLQDSLPPPPQISRKLWPLLARNKKVCCRKTYE